MTPSASGNHIAEELIRKHGELSPPAQRAIGLSQVPAIAETSLSPQLPPAAPEVQAAPASMPAAATTTLPAPSKVRGLGPLPGSPQAENRDELARVQASRPGYMDINIPGKAGHVLNPVLKGLAGIGDVIGTGFFPRAAMAIPGTSLHHQMLVNQLRGNEQQFQGQQAAEDTQRLQEARAESEESMPAYRQAETETSQQRAKIAQQEADQAAKSFPGQEAERTARTRHLNAQAEALESPAAKGNIHVLPDGKVISVSTDPQTGKATAEVVFEGDPRQKTKAEHLEIGGEEHTVLIDESNGQVIKDLGKTGNKAPVVNVNAATNQLDRESARFAKPHEKAISDASAQLEKIAEAKAMINGPAASQALGIPKVLTALVSGAGSGVRITQAELNSIARARGLSGDVEGFINRISGKGTLTAEQQRQLSGILDDVGARVRQKQAIANEALDNINSAASRDEILRHEKAARQRMTEMESGAGSPTGGGQVKVQQKGSEFRYSTDGGKTWHPGKPPNQ